MIGARPTFPEGGMKSRESHRCEILRASRDLLRDLAQSSPLGSQLSSAK
jgi:hypothetical protein